MYLKRGYQITSYEKIETENGDFLCYHTMEKEICRNKKTMKNIYLIGGTMGVGKTTTCQILKNKLPNCVFLDGDWCWDMHPFQVTPETKKMAMENICFLLNQFIRCIAYENIIFCWVMHEQAIMDEILLKLKTENCLVHTISLTC